MGHDDEVVEKEKKKQEERGTKGKGKGDRNPLTNEQMAKIPCRDSLKGNCRYGDKC